MSPAETRTSRSKGLEMLSRNRIVAVLRLLMSREGRKAGEGNRKLLNLNSRGEQGRLMQNIHKRFDCSIILGEATCTGKVITVLWDNSAAISGFLGDAGGCPG